MGDSNPGVPEALPRVLRAVGRHFGVETVDRVWIFPPLRTGRKESGLVAVSRYEVDPAPDPEDAGTDGEVDAELPEAGMSADPDRRRLYTAAYTAERTGRGVTVEPVLSEEGWAPPDRLPRVMQGVVHRSGDDRGEAREVAVSGDPRVFEELVEQLEALVEPEFRSTLEP